jgi:hypothetical protein
MAQYKVPQDVEADDKLLGPFSFRQFVYLLIAGALLALAIGLFQLFPVLVIIPIPFILFFLALALPLKKDQPMETYLAALLSFYLKPRKRTWKSGQRETTINITAPKIVDDIRTKDITSEEATNRLSFLANIVDTEGRAIKNVGTGSQVNDELKMEAKTANDMFENYQYDNLEKTIADDENKRHAEVVNKMKEAIAENENITHEVVKKQEDNQSAREANYGSPTIVMPGAPIKNTPVEKSNVVYPKKTEKTQAKPSIMELANNPDFSVATIAKEANRINRKEDGEVFISLH